MMARHERRGGSAFGLPATLSLVLVLGCGGEAGTTSPDAELADTTEVRDAGTGGGEADVPAIADVSDAGEELSEGPRPLSESCDDTEVPEDEVSLPEASGAVFVPRAGAAGSVLIVADSGNKGAGLRIDLESWAESAVTFPLDAGASDDVEGLTLAPDGVIVGITSSGYVRHWELGEAGPEQVADAYPVREGGETWTCQPQGSNCGPNYEGICLHPAPKTGSCAGFAVSKGYGSVVCLVEEAGRYVVDPARVIEVGSPEEISGCAFEREPPYRMVVAGNIYTLSKLYEVRGYDEPGGAEVELVGVQGPANQEALVFAPGGLLLSFGDIQNFGEISPLAAFQCQ